MRVCKSFANIASLATTVNSAKTIKPLLYIAIFGRCIAMATELCMHATAQTTDRPCFIDCMGRSHSLREVHKLQYAKYISGVHLSLAIVSVGRIT